ncbi:bifunctional diaminohydroxyphosphoribosylaminopyrimidine deaminase/5-amino-6-(5-phosphoribosylamino)uracil reductase RibD [Sphingomonas sp. ID1715]|uniref:bifunctional diaminohydroxyphosphoribosylaminopyrimidine deaminase/5-amino-6-(5-phosphoribosylamino)uracil reductase RibD n=1 Tax=Sphingomonas sp. ID1715 TaxID=1656898 RepID=UPI0014891C4E|nr:bifunctional diaminohydroxyphosphoribosylaminopyrimidine deaminase/5-amino-6-(5-phosphoribosylamino)uracil reductase RibD [Sphingomonas sp. ID1715]NNM78342.1 bifunctional diaminohydroxyphosphoribosylaminopyrimidine deaminase/5-amino-6-(5-phosphoribosylamino)uracil reductase RibD [Sphingomonas sp. ID1715]
MGAALALAERGRGRTAPNPSVGCVILKDGRVIGRGWTQPGGRPHAEAVALAQAGAEARGATLYVTLEPCAHVSARGPACAELIVAAGVKRVAAAMQDPDPRTCGLGFERLRSAGIEVVSGIREAEARAAIAGFLARRALGRPFVTLKLATSLDGCIALADGTSRWITGAPARAHAHLERSRHEAILVGRGTWEVDAPKLDVRLEGLEAQSPMRVVLSSFPGEGRGRTSERTGPRPSPGNIIDSPDQIATLPGDHLLVEGGAQTAAAFLRAELVDRLLLYRAPILIGGGKASLGDIGLADLAAAHGRWQLADARMLGSDRLEVYVRQR